MAYSKEASDIPTFVAIRPVYDNATGAITSVPSTFVWVRRVKNDADPNDQLDPIETASKTVDIFDGVKTVTIPGVGAVSYRKIAQGLKLIADAERGA